MPPLRQLDKTHLVKVGRCFRFIKSAVMVSDVGDVGAEYVGT